jgi:hypothetical protein
VGFGVLMAVITSNTASGMWPTSLRRVEETFGFEGEGNFLHVNEFLPDDVTCKKKLFLVEAISEHILL